jgi:hypothetical protein
MFSSALHTHLHMLLVLLPFLLRPGRLSHVSCPVQLMFLRPSAAFSVQPQASLLQPRMSQLQIFSERLLVHR